MQIKRRDKAVDHSHPAQGSWLMPWGTYIYCECRDHCHPADACAEYLRTRRVRAS